ncbi:MAG: 30S ribosomal protein S16 [Alphaproteobacteria bacterium]|nr:30S ribosomal protein S16 [Alphaproteobacteria bacterium]
MALKIRLTRGGAKKRPFYRLVVAEASSPRDGRFVEKVGTYNPLLDHGHADRVVLNIDRIKHWLSVGAQPSERVGLFLSNAGLFPKKERTPDPKKSAPRKRAQERLKAEQEAAIAAKEAAAAPPPPAPEPAPAEARVEEAPAAVVEEAAVPVEATPAVEEAPAPAEEPQAQEETPA